MTLSGVSFLGEVPVLVFHIGLHPFSKVRDLSHTLALYYVLSTAWNVLCFSNSRLPLRFPFATTSEQFLWKSPPLSNDVPPHLRLS